MHNILVKVQRILETTLKALVLHQFEQQHLGSGQSFQGTRDALVNPRKQGEEKNSRIRTTTLNHFSGDKYCQVLLKLKNLQKTEKIMMSYIL